MKNRILISLSFFLCLTASHGALVWQQTEVLLQPTVEENILKTGFTFTNSGNQDVIISNIKTSCGCTTTKLEKTTFSPGESYTIPVTFDIGSRKGTQRKTIQVQASDQEEAHRLNLVIEIPASVEASTRILTWKTGEEAINKSINIETFIPDLTIKEISSNNQAVNYTIEPSESGYRLDISPKSTTLRIRTSISLILTNGTRDFPLTFFAYVR